MPQTIDDFHVPTPTIEEVTKEYAVIQKALDHAASPPERLAAVKSWDDLRRRLETWSALVDLRFNQDTGNEEFKKAREFREKAGAKADARPVPDKVEEARVKALLDGQKSAASAPAATGDYALQVGAFASDDKVREARDKLASAGIKSFVEKLDTREGGRTRVRAGPFATREAAETARERVRGLGFPDAAVVSR